METEFDITVIDADQNEEIPIIYKIRFDDTINMILNKISVEDEGEGGIYRPDIVQLYVKCKNRNVYADVKNQKDMVLYDLTQDGSIKDNVIYVKSLMTKLADMIEEGGETDTDKHPDLKNPDSDRVTNLFNRFRNEYPRLTSRVFHQVLMDVNDESTSFEKETQKYLKDMATKLKVYQKPIAQLPVNKIKDPSIDKITDRTNNGKEYDVALSNLLLEFPRVYEKFFIKPDRLFDVFVLTEKVPFITVSTGEGRGNAYQKVLKSFQNDPVKLELAKSWMITPKKKMKTPRGLMLKVKVDNNRYSTVNIYNNGRVTIRIAFTEQENAKEEKVKEIVKTVATIIKGINTNLGKHIFDYSKIPENVDKRTIMINVPKYENAEFKSINATMRVYVSLDKSKIEDKIRQRDSPLASFVAINRSYERKRAEKAREKGVRATPTDSVYLKYKKYSKHIQKYKDQQRDDVDSDTLESGLGFIMRRNLLFEDSVTVKITNCQRMFQIQVLADFMVSLIRIVYKKVGEQAIEVVKPVEKTKDVARLKMLQDAGIYGEGPDHGRECQKPVQPLIDDGKTVMPFRSKDIPKNRYGKDRPDSYDLMVKGKRLVCTNVQKPYPGYKRSGIPCCFAEDQRNKPNFKKYHKPEEFEREARKEDRERGEISRDNIITTKKILDAGRIGKLHGNIKKLFDNVSKDNYFRVGVYQQKDSFLNAIFEAIRKDKDLSKVIRSTQQLKKYLVDNLSEDAYYDLQGGRVAKTFPTFSAFKRHIETTNTLDEDLGLDLVSNVLNINVFIFSEKSDNIVCNSDYDRLQEKRDTEYNIFLLKKEPPEKTVHYEPIFKIKPGKDVIRMFKDSSTVSKTVKDLYIMSCNSTPIVRDSRYAPALSSIEVKNLVKKAQDVENRRSKDRYKVKIMAQIIGATKNTIYLIIKFVKNQSNQPIELIVPVKPSKKLNSVRKISLNSQAFKNYMKAVSPRLIESYQDLHAVTKIPVRIQSQILSNDKIIALGTESRLMIPTKPSPRLMDLSIDSRNFYIDVDYDLTGNFEAVDKRQNTMKNLEYLQQLNHQIRYEISEYFSNHKNEADKLSKIVLDKEMSRSDKLKEISKDVKVILSKIAVETNSLMPAKLGDIRNSCVKHGSNKDDCTRNPFCKFSDTHNSCKLEISKRYARMSEIVKIITQEIVRDTRNQLILKGKITAHMGRPGTFITRPGETVLINIDNVLSWLEKERVIRRRK